MEKEAFEKYSVIEHIIPMFSYKTRKLPTNILVNIKEIYNTTKTYILYNIIENVVFVKSSDGLKMFELAEIDSIGIIIKPLAHRIDKPSMKSFENDGWVLVNILDEENERTTAFTIGITPDKLFQAGSTFNMPSTEVFFDKKLKVFWRMAGHIN